MKTCPYCGKQYPDDSEVCGIDKTPLIDWVESKAGASPKVTCPECEATDDYTRLVEPRGSFSMAAFLFGGLLAVIFQNAGKPRRVRCNKCEARFYVESPFSKVSRVIFWLLITPAILALVVFMAWIAFCLISH